MKLKSISTLVLTALLAFGVVGCKKKMDRTSPLPGYGAGPTIRDVPPGGHEPSQPIGNPPILGQNMPVGPEGVIPSSNRDITGRPTDREKYRAQTVYFDFDRSTVKAKEATKVQEIANKFKREDPNSDLLIEGHCDERGTEGYNTALGERRAQAVREMLVGLGVPADHIHTVSFGKDKPAETGHNEAAWGKNRRGEFILVLPK